MTEEIPKGYSNTQIYAAEYMRDFADKMSKCKNTLEYCELVTGVLVFGHLIKGQFQELYELDRDDADRMLTELDKAAKKIAKLVLDPSSIEDVPPKEMN